MKTGQYLGIGLIVVAGLLLLPNFVDGFSIGTKEKGSNLVTCDVTVNSGITTPRIDSFNCRAVRECSFFETLTGKSIIGAKGYVSLVMSDGATANDNYNIGISIAGATRSLKLDVCTTSPTGKLYLYNQNNEILQTKEVGV